MHRAKLAGDAEYAIGGRFDGCLLVRTPEVMRFDDCEYPMLPLTEVV